MDLLLLGALSGAVVVFALRSLRTLLHRPGPNTDPEFPGPTEAPEDAEQGEV